ncbi:MAG: dihydrodipicolinate synthase family protein [Deltaproteobacteria bacterium]|nr:dihydrodipicolinate synthase family protein [Deltaproteobacteria bacterium]MBW2414527.1 dihydrodipicolinate synthase family protein [Deltaproteobacteria bacterium]
MKTLETWIPRRGLSIPCVTVLDPDGGVLEDDQRRLVRFLVQSGRGADVLFAMGTTGEWNALGRDQRHGVMRIAVEEVRKSDSRLARGGQPPVEAWVGVTAPTAAETLESFEFALSIGADAAVVAPLAISDVDDPVRFLMRDVADLLDARNARIPVFLYDNADIAVGRERHLRTRWVKQMSRLDFVRGIKVSAPPRKLGHYTKAARQFRDLGAFGIYVGDALYVLDMMRPRSGVWGTIVEHWNRFLLHDLLPAGVVAGPANLWPREWQYAWQVASAGDVERMASVRSIFERFRASYVFPEGKRTLAALKRGLVGLGVISSDAVARGTPALDARQAGSFDAAFEELRSDVRARLPERWCSDPAEATET